MISPFLAHSHTEVQCIGPYASIAAVQSAIPGPDFAPKPACTLSGRAAVRGRAVFRKRNQHLVRCQWRLADRFGWRPVVEGLRRALLGLRRALKGSTKHGERASGGPLTCSPATRPGASPPTSPSCRSCCVGRTTARRRPRAGPGQKKSLDREAEARMASHAKPTPDERKSMPDAGTDEDILISAAAEGRQP
jgi:hypothetical protein